MKKVIWTLVMVMCFGCAGCLPEPAGWIVEKQYDIPENIPSGGKIKWTYPFSSGDEWNVNLAIGSDGTAYLSTHNLSYDSVTSSVTDYKIHAINSDGTSKWFFDFGIDISLLNFTPVIGQDGTLYQLARCKNNSQYSMNLYAISPEGTQKWIASIPEELMSMGPMIDSTGTIYLQASASYEHPYQLYAFNTDGTEKWATGSEITRPLSFIGLDGNLYTISDSIGSTSLTKRQATNSSSNSTRTLQALNSSDGSVWREVEIFEDIMPVVSTEGTIYASNENQLLAYTSEGKRSWTFTAAYYENIASLSIGAENAVYVIADYVETAPINVRHSQLYALNAEGKIKWQLPIGNGFPTLHIGPDGTIYLLSDQILYAVNPDGSWKWRFESEETFTSMTVGPEGMVYPVSSTGMVYAIKDTGAEGE
jgi:hypothetical protein